MKTLATLLAVTCALGGLTGCEQQLLAPTEAGVCWHLVQPPGQPPKFNKLAEHQVDLEHCGAELERMRINFRALGENEQQVIGAYQGQYLFDDDTGISTSQTLKGHPYSLMVRSGDGRLVVPGAMPQQ
jgi:hypothetical protein